MARVLFFGKLGDIAGARERDFTLAEGVVTVAHLIEALKQQDQALGDAISAESVHCIVNEKLVGREASITDDDEIAFLPPVSGG